jgi:peptidoglycan-associated lipoprotein
MRHFIGYILVLFLSALASCSVSKDIRKADKHYDYGEYNAAAVIYTKAYRRIPAVEKNVRAEVAYRQGECYRFINQSVKAENAYMKAIRYGLPNDSVLLHYAEVLRKNAKYEAAEIQYRQFLENHPGDLQASYGLESCLLAREWKNKPKKYAVNRVQELYLKRGNFSPLLVPAEYKTLLFTSSSIQKEGKKPSKITGLPDNDFFITRLDQNEKWEKPLPIEGAINSEFDEGVGCFDPDGKVLYFTRCVNKSDSALSGSSAEIYRSVRSGEQWSEPEKLNIFRDTNAVFAHPAISPDGLYLYYVSDMKGGYGGKDIWRSAFYEKSFGPPENLGPQINTPGDEMFPTIRTDGSLYFSSNTLPGLGGLDIFKAVYNEEDSSWTVENVYDLNSSADDFGITFFGKKEKGLFSSNRNEPRGWDKIWSFGEPEQLTQISGWVTDRFGEPIPEATIRIVNDKGTNTKVVSRRDGSYSYQVEKNAEYVMLATCRSYLNYSNQFVTTDKDSNYVVNFSLTSLFLPVRIENIFFEFDRWELRPESGPALQELLKLLLDNPHITIEIGAHTDRKGDEEYNLKLSEKRAESVVNYLIKYGIDKERLSAQGYGKSKPAKVDKYMETNYPYLKEGSFLDESFVETLSLQQQEIADQINRRCEFKVLKTTYKLF